MASTNLFKALKPHKSVSKNAFDLSHKVVFSGKAGLLDCPLALETVPGDYFKIDMTSLTRTMTMNTAAFLRGSMKYDFYFVPYTLLWSPFNQFITQRDDRSSVNQKGHVCCPVANLGSVLNMIYTWYNSPQSESYDSYWFDHFNQNIAHGALRLLDELGYGNFRIILDMDEQQFDAFSAAYATYDVNVFRLAAYQAVWYHYYRNKFYDTDSQTPGSTAQSMRNYISYYNFDDVQCDGMASADIFDFSQDVSKRRLAGLLTQRHRQWKKDLFTSAMPSQQFGAVSAVDIVDKEIVNKYFSQQGTSNVASLATSGSDNKKLGIRASASSVAFGATRWEIPSAFDVLSLRKAEVLQNWKQATLRAGNMTDDNFEAHYGVTPYYENDHMPHFLGSFSANMDVNAVESSAATGSEVNGAVGDLAGRGVSLVQQGDTFEFSCRDFGVIICMASYLPEAEYNSIGIDKANTLCEEFDFFTPEFQDIGLEAVPRSQYDFITDYRSFNSVMGYAPRYYMYKQRVDRVLGDFASYPRPIFLEEGVAPISDPAVLGGSLRAWVAPRTEASVDTQNSFTKQGRSLATFYVPSNILDPVLALQSDETSSTDYLLHNCFFQIQAVRPMSVLGLPQF